MYQVVALHYNKDLKRTNLVYLRGGKVENYEQLVFRTQEVLNRVQNNYSRNILHNVFFTAAHTASKQVKFFMRQELIPFDIDSIDYTKIDDYLNIFSEVTGVPWKETWVIKTGHGLHIIVRTHYFTDEEFFKKHKPHYLAICKELERRFEEAGLPCKEVDPALWAKSKHPRLPFTLNVKPRDKPYNTASEVSNCVEYNSAVNVHDFNWEKWAPGNEGKHTKKSWDGSCPDHSPNFIFDECSFLKEQLSTGGASASEKEWFAALGVVAHIKTRGGAEYDDRHGHAVSDRHPTYTFLETQRKIEHCRESSGPRTCETISHIYDKCSECKHFNSGIGTPLNLRPAMAPVQDAGEDLEALLQAVDIMQLHRDAGGDDVPALPIKIADPTFCKKESGGTPPLEAGSGKESENVWLKWFETGFAEIEEGELGKNGKKKKDKYIRQYSVLARYLGTRHHVFNVPDLKRTYVYKEGSYHVTNDDSLRKNADTFFTTGGRVLKKDRAELLEAVKLTNIKDLNFVREKFLNDGLINLNNGVLKIKNRELTPHSPKNYFNYKLPFDYVPGAKCPVWDQFMGIATQGRHHLQRVLEEYIAYIVRGGEYSIHKFLAMYGGGRNGKGTVCKLTQKLVGKENWTSVSCAKLEQPFEAVRLEDALVNISEEEKISSMRDTSALKAMTGQSPIIVGKKFENSYPIINKAKLILTYNTLPKIFDSSQGMKERALLVPLQYNFEEDPDGLRIEDIDKKLEGELPGILNRCLDALERLEERGRFEEIQESKEVFERLIEDSSEVKHWIGEEIQVTGNEGDRIPTKVLYQMFLDDNPRARVTRNNFAKDVVEVLESSEGAKKMGAGRKVCKLNGRPIKCYYGIVMLSDARQGVQKREGGVVSKITEAGAISICSEVTQKARIQGPNLGEF